MSRSDLWALQICDLTWQKEFAGVVKEFEMVQDPEPYRRKAEEDWTTGEEDSDVTQEAGERRGCDVWPQAKAWDISKSQKKEGNGFSPWSLQEEPAL